MMGFTPRRNVGLDLALLQGCDVLLAPEAVIQGSRRRRTEFQGQGGQGGFNFGFVIEKGNPRLCRGDLNSLTDPGVV
jgi:hypothetical protein